MARDITISRDEAELLVDVLEDNYRTQKFSTHSGTGADLASKIRILFGMKEQPEIEIED